MRHTLKRLLCDVHVIFGDTLLDRVFPVQHLHLQFLPAFVQIIQAVLEGRRQNDVAPS